MCKKMNMNGFFEVNTIYCILGTSYSLWKKLQYTIILYIFYLQNMIIIYIAIA